ncbi:type II toxin-antitoxin system prevent-host-death family antitoxin [Acinetobacter bereziniae]|uniref:type II toxin-antitoxin system Phd/YefM family antitoxin n=1 Tax=Acinetobacter bereziniae TaxID=106648 RepID=UPI0019041E5B|nr:type II toxin-antitoxin system prevent-host-death family antitoxin [Acinetobacter bereziniae]MDG3555843.1 type II toxin-antitoxin system prevent-host-death family antitoxin [Acinetobacter bereziniae]MDP5999794.1 type II toxin-antitoxin system prevent-host-death family antitoxin [Acinetobacter bereziniae]QQC81228.1 type II toxin-antitoxin system prevent-host-death family antitoxin [Acinetobacter bereziniae]UUN94333.1 type II toxin-antitoxin system prevent-host-death family antitoxin [Acinetob
MKITTATEARANFKTVLDQTIDDADITIIHRRDGENAVLMSESQYNSIMETLHLLSTPANARALERAIAQDKANHGVKRELLDAE